MRPEVARCHLVASVLSADGMMAPEERAFLQRVMAQLGLDAEEQRRVLDFEGAADALMEAQRQPLSDRQGIVDMIVEAALVDGKLSPYETATVKKIADALSL